MLFNSYVFLLAFLPITLVTFRALDWAGWRRASMAWLASASLFFYAWWNPPYILLMLSSLAFNYGVGRLLSRRSGSKASRLVLGMGVVANLALLGYYKYWNFFLENAGLLLGRPFPAASIFLPVGISFFTFQQIAFLVDAYRGETKEYDAVDYCLFVTFFPQLIAGPIVHHKDVLPQFERRAVVPLESPLFGAGLTLLVLGLCKKVVLADTFAPTANALFRSVEKGAAPGFLESWTGVLAYTLQIYFDFSGYSDMAVGLGWLFGITLPQNFFSPYRATSIIDFWRRWHMTLSRFLRDYLYIPLGGGRKGRVRRYLNLLITMLLGGLWHGANWTFVAWGGLHGLFLATNHLWRGRRPKATRMPRLLGQLLTMGCVTFAWVFFRATSLGAARRVLLGMVGAQGRGTLSGWLEPALVVLALLMAMVAPNSVELMTARGFVRHPEVAFEDGAHGGRWLSWQPTRVWALGTAALAMLGLLFLVRDVARESPFLYYQF